MKCECLCYSDGWIYWLVFVKNEILWSSLFCPQPDAVSGREDPAVSNVRSSTVDPPVFLQSDLPLDLCLQTNRKERQQVVPNFLLSPTIVPEHSLDNLNASGQDQRQDPPDPWS